jgi:hypothetical protein
LQKTLWEATRIAQEKKKSPSPAIQVTPTAYADVSSTEMRAPPFLGGIFQMARFIITGNGKDCNNFCYVVGVKT